MQVGLTFLGHLDEDDLNDDVIGEAETQPGCLARAGRTGPGRRPDGRKDWEAERPRPAADDARGRDAAAQQKPELARPLA